MAKKKIKNKQKNKVNLVFDEEKRSDYLCGFRKRKLERKKKAQEELQKLLKDEKKRIKIENKESYKKMVVSYRPIPDIEQLLQDEYEDDDVNVKIVELSSETMKKKDLWIGENKPKEDLSEKKPEKTKVAKNNDVPGMGLDDESENEASVDEKKEDSNPNKTKKEVKRILKKQATKNIQKSKVFQMKNKLDRIKNKKKSHHKTQAHGHGKKTPRKDKSKKGVAKRKHANKVLK